MFNTVLFREEKNGNNLLSYNKELGTSMTQSYNGILHISLITDVNKCLKIWENIHDLSKKLYENIYSTFSISKNIFEKNVWSSKCEIVWDFNCIFTLFYIFQNFFNAHVLPL